MPLDEEGTLVVLSGPAGSGKSTVAERLVKTVSGVRRAVTATTRKPRPGEKHSEDYYFLTREEFLKRIEHEDFLEYTVFNGNHYGTPRRELGESLAKGGVVLLVIEVDGAESIKFFYPDAIFVFIVPPTPDILRERLMGRGTESSEEVERRLQIAKNEMRRVGEYDFLVVNSDPHMATLDLAAIIRTVRRSRIRGDEEQRWLDGFYADWQTRVMDRDWK